MNRATQIILLLFLIFSLILIRHYADSIFYDPLISFFKSDYSTNPIPQFHTLNLLANVSLRFLINTMLSLAILVLLFKDKGIIKLAAILYLTLFFILILAFSFLLFYSESNKFLPLFYVRRFLIQPIFLLVLIPAFYFQIKK